MKAGTQQKAEEKKPRRRIKKVAGHGGHHGGAWKVAYADFVTAMMALFLVLWLVSQADTKLKEAIANYFRNPGVFNTIRGGVLSHSRAMSKESGAAADSEALMAAAEMLRQKFESSPQFNGSKDKVRIDITDEGLRIQIIDRLERVSFQSGGAELTEEAREILSEIAQGICNLPNPIFIGGHTDRHLFPEGSAYTNWELSADRANAARRALEASCVKPEQIRRVIGYADTELLVPGNPFAESNRRISIIIRRKGADARAVSASSIGEAKADQPEESPSENRRLQNSGEKEGQDRDPNESPALNSSEKQSNLKSKEEISVGTPDKIPEGVRRTRAIN
jgi:chemotaxis protein MotB